MLEGVYKLFFSFSIYNLLWKKYLPLSLSSNLKLSENSPHELRIRSVIIDEVHRYPLHIFVVIVINAIKMPKYYQ